MAVQMRKSRESSTTPGPGIMEGFGGSDRVSLGRKWESLPIHDMIHPESTGLHASRFDALPNAIILMA